jgi:hypothetical protein
MQSKDTIRARVGIEPKDAPPEPVGNGEVEQPPQILSLQDILDAPDLGERVVEVPRWHGAVVIRGLSRDEFLRCKVSSTDARGNIDEPKFEKALLVMALVRPAINHGTVGQLYAKGVAEVGVIIKAIMSHLGADPEALKSGEIGDDL